MGLTEFNIRFLILMLVQILISSVLNLSQFVMISILPVMILFLPTERSTPAVLGIAFATGFAVDFLSSGMLGLTVSALLPVALARSFVMQIVFGSEIFARSEDLSTGRQGILKIATATLILNAVYLGMFIWLESAGTRPMGLCIAKFFISLLISTVLSIFAANVLRSKS